MNLNQLSSSTPVCERRGVTFSDTSTGMPSFYFRDDQTAMRFNVVTREPVFHNSYNFDSGFGDMTGHSRVCLILTETVGLRCILLQHLTVSQRNA